MNPQIWKQEQRKKRGWRVRRALRRGTARNGRPRLAVHRTLKQIYAQIIDDDAGRTIAQASTVDKEIRGQLPDGKGGNKAAAEIVGRIVAERARAAGVTDVVFDRGGYRFHGRVKALAEAARKAELKF